ncbi:hypothetical protein H6G20_09520 [Desertifilum sp. FACHB-1129]|uniref:Uncharacterized protein n=2 Tax=Desertifilum tharense IPPAS B-1220 TaxID=1781255 RepID=A0A1E5QQD0_9CYAN|nr:MULTISPECIES: hypothetical protein [Desertifilum]MDA0209242.1 hypothetical protein [Cyanobacteria bacterium FC1]MBD2311896.1 hypothetical protein [Desertifilum sp. FACHB-1129]MBD2323041.1 hypothetical protein [Desertifilum sp. FACHB-866]MBD2333472.1 hypothetical protein [Desertifilum sp. FACHB-868]OEJ76879.1 hypothetical protein BH720_02570 [Desertifilum tharense IPPAS B-1220]
MSAVEFTARVRDGQIEVPEEYQEMLAGVERVKITVTSQKRTAAVGSIARLINNPIKLKTFVSLSREEAHERG